MSLLTELRRRGVLQTLIGYVGLVWLAVQVLETTLPAFDLPDIYIRWLIVGAAILLLPVLAFSWIFEWSPGGLTTQKAVDANAKESALPGSTSRRADLVVIGILVVAVTYFAVDKFVVQQSAHKDNSIAVVPFEFLPRGSEQSYISYGIAADILGKLARNVSLRLAPQSVSFAISPGESPLAFGRELGVGYVLAGSVREQDSTLQVTVQLLSTEDGLSIWGNSFTTTDTQLFRAVNQVATEIETSLGVEQAQRTLEHTPHPEAYRKRLNAVYLAANWTEEDAQRSLQEIRAALEIDPEYALAWSNLGSIIANAANAGWVPREEAYRESKQVIRKLLEIVPNASVGYRAAARLAMNYEGDLAAAVVHMEQALAREPDDLVVLTDASTLLMQTGRLDEALALEEYIVERSPFSALSSHNLVLKYLYADQLDSALSQNRRTVELEPGRAHTNYWFGEIHLLMGDVDQAAEFFAKETDEAYRLKGAALVAFARNQPDEGEVALAELIEKFGVQWPSEVAHVYAYSGQNELAFDWLEKEIATYGTGGWGEWQLQRLYDNLRETPEWDAFLMRQGAHASQLRRQTLKIDLDRYQ